MPRSLLETGAVRLVPDLVPAHAPLYEALAGGVEWDERIRARKSMSFGLPYNYSGIVWPAVPFPAELAELLETVARAAGFVPNNCLANFYPDGTSTMGFHSDSTAELEPGTGIAVLSLGAERALTFRRAEDKRLTESYTLAPGSLLVMCPEMQVAWRHAVLADPTCARGRISLTFRRIRSEVLG